MEEWKVSGNYLIGSVRHVLFSRGFLAGVGVEGEVGCGWVGGGGLR